MIFNALIFGISFGMLFDSGIWVTITIIIAIAAVALFIVKIFSEKDNENFRKE